MAKTCIKCGYTRRSSDRGPDYACPSCGIVYAKAEAARAEIEAARARTAQLAAAARERSERAPTGAAEPAAGVVKPNGRAELLLQQMMAAQGDTRRAPRAMRGMALVALVAFSVGFASAAGMYSGLAKLAKAPPPAAAACTK